MPDETKGVKLMKPVVTIPAADYRRLLELVEFDDRLIVCETCGAWIDREDPAYCTAEDYTGCWKVATHSGDETLCRSYRATVLEVPAGRSALADYEREQDSHGEG